LSLSNAYCLSFVVVAGGGGWGDGAVQSVSGFQNIWTCPTSSLSLFFYSEYGGTRFLTNVDTYPSTIFLQIDSIATYNTHTLPPSATVNSEDIYTMMKLWVPVQLLYPDGFLIILKLWLKINFSGEYTETWILHSWRNSLQWT